MRAKYCMECGNVVQAHQTKCTECCSENLHEVRSLVEGLYTKIENLQESKKKIRKSVPNF